MAQRVRRDSSTFVPSDGDTDLYFLRARYYDPDTGRFLGRDPVEFAQRYAYAANHPATFTDPSGLCWLGLPCPKKKDLDGLIDDMEDDLSGFGEWVGETAPQVRQGIIDQTKSALSVLEPTAQEVQQVARAWSSDTFGFAQLEHERCNFFCGVGGVANPMSGDVDPHVIIGGGSYQHEISGDIFIGQDLQQSGSCQGEINIMGIEMSFGATFTEDGTSFARSVGASQFTEGAAWSIGCRAMIDIWR